MSISWYPGHMHKASKELSKIMRNTQLVIEVLDARTPLSSCNPLLADIRKELPCIWILNKADLAEEESTTAWAEYFSRQKNSACLINGRDKRLDKTDILSAARKLLFQVNNKLPSKAQMVIEGIPNVGKSTLLNQFMDRKVAKTGNEPAVTKRQQRVRLDEGWYLVDTPGMLWPKLEDQNSAYRLAATGTIRNTAVEAEDIAWFLAELLLKDYFPQIRSRYELAETDNTPELFFAQVARQRGSLTRGGRPNWHKTAEILLNEFRSGKLGRFSLETPPS